MPNLSRAEIFGITLFTILALFWVGDISYGLYKSGKESHQKAQLEQSDKPKPIFVHIDGAVGKSGLYELPVGCRVADALKVAGGAVLNADLSGINLADTLKDGDKLYVPFKNAPIPKEFADNPIRHERSVKKPETPKKVNFPININSATMEELMALPDIGEVRAKAIIEYRSKRGGFKKLEEIKNVKGIGDGIYKKIKDLICI